MKAEKIKRKDKLNKLCLKCERRCKQSEDTILIGCPHFSFKPVQLEIVFKNTKVKK